MRLSVLGVTRFARCSVCRKLTLKENLRPGPEGGMLGPGCFEAAMREWVEAERRA